MDRLDAPSTIHGHTSVEGDDVGHEFDEDQGVVGSPPKAEPTAELYPELQRAYRHFNDHLFDGKLPPVLITLQRKNNTPGYWSANRFADKQGVRAGELALNPRYFAVCSAVEVLSVLVHEQVHVWQTYFGKPGRRGYHNREWADKMVQIGLHPTSNGQPDGASTGEQMTHYILTGEAFDVAARGLLESGKFDLGWYDRFPAEVRHGRLIAQPPVNEGPSTATVTASQDVTSDEATMRSANELAAPSPRAVTTVQPLASAPEAVDPAPQLPTNFAQRPAQALHIDSDAVEDRPAFNFPALGLEAATAPSRENRTRAKFTCPGCRDNTWGKPTLQIKCMRCDQPFRIEDAKRTV